MKTDTILRFIAVLVAACLFVTALDFMKDKAEYVAPLAGFLTVVILAMLVFMLNKKGRYISTASGPAETVKIVKVPETKDNLKPMMQELLDIQKKFLQDNINLTLAEKRLSCISKLDLLSSQFLNHEIKSLQNIRDGQVLLNNISFFFGINPDELEAVKNSAAKYLFLKSKVEYLHNMRHESVFREIVDAYPRVDKLCHDIINEVFRDKFIVTTDELDRYFKYFENISAHMLIQTDEAMESCFKSFMGEYSRLRLLMAQKMPPLASITPEEKA